MRGMQQRVLDAIIARREAKLHAIAARLDEVPAKTPEWNTLRRALRFARTRIGEAREDFKTKPGNVHLWWTTNKKLAKDRIVAFGIPAGVTWDGTTTCPAAHWCRDICWAANGWEKSRGWKKFEYNFAAWLALGAAKFAELAIEDTWSMKRRFDYLRVHDGGDFFNREYLLSWFEIVSNAPQIGAYAYTKSLHLNDLLWGATRPQKLRIVQSNGGRFDDKIDVAEPHCLIFETDHQIERSDYTNCSHSDRKVVQRDGAVKIGIRFHGSWRPALASIYESTRRIVARASK